jgi:hypothetical protein
VSDLKYSDCNKVMYTLSYVADKSMYSNITVLLIITDYFNNILRMFEQYCIFPNCSAFCCKLNVDGVNIVLPVYSLCGMQVPPNPSSEYAGKREVVRQYGVVDTVAYNNRFLVHSGSVHVWVVYCWLQQTTVRGRAFTTVRGDSRAGKCWNLTGTGTRVCCKFCHVYY